MEKFGAYLEGSTVMAFSKTGRRQTHLLTTPIAYAIRRFVYISTVVWMQSFTGQIWVQLFLTLLQICMLLDRRRSESLLAYRLEIVNEIMLVQLYYVMMGYAMFVLEGAA